MILDIDSELWIYTDNLRYKNKMSWVNFWHLHVMLACLHLSINLSVCLPVRLSVCLSIHQSINPHIHLSIVIDIQTSNWNVQVDAIYLPSSIHSPTHSPTYLYLCIRIPSVCIYPLILTHPATHQSTRASPLLTISALGLRIPSIYVLKNSSIHSHTPSLHQSTRASCYRWIHPDGRTCRSPRPRYDRHGDPAV